MIVINQNNVGLVKIYKDNILNNVGAIYYKDKLVWPTNLIKSCFGGGIWIDTYPWLDTDIWKD